MVGYSIYFSVRTSFGGHQCLICEKQTLNYLVVFWGLTGRASGSIVYRRYDGPMYRDCILVCF